MLLTNIRSIKTPQNYNKNIILLVASFDNKNYQHKLIEQEQIETPIEFNKWCLNRQAEYIAGRILVKKATLMLKLPCYTITHQHNQAPKWNKLFNGSISHKKNLVTALVTSQTNSQIGIDLELKQSEVKCVKIANKICSRKEIENAKKIDIDFYYTLMFSIKESIFKLINNHKPHQISLKEIIIKEVDIEKKEYWVTLDKNINSNFNKKTIIKGNYIEEEKYILTKNIIY